MLTEYNSNQNADFLVPDEVKNHFNWGAFFIMPFWGLGNNIYISILLLLPVFSKRFLHQHSLAFLTIIILLSFWFGVKGNEWA